MPGKNAALKARLSSGSRANAPQRVVGGKSKKTSHGSLNSREQQNSVEMSDNEDLMGSGDEAGKSAPS